MASTLTSSGELTFCSFGIEKVESTEDGDLLVYGKATDATLDHDQQIIDPVFSTKAMAEWMATGANVRKMHDPHSAVGVGVEINTDKDGGTWVKALVVDDLAKKLVSKGVLRAYSVGIANPTIERDMTGKARGGIIKNGKIVELSLVDRPANPSCGVQLVKSAMDGHAEPSGELFGDNDSIVKALNSTMVKSTSYDESVNNIDQFESPSDINLDFTPTDLMRILAEKTMLKGLVDSEREILGKDHREFSAGRRRELASGGNALPDGSYPIPDADALRRAAILARSGHGNVSGARALIARRAKELGVANPLNSDDSEKTVETVDLGKDAVPESCEPDVDENDDGKNSIPKPGKAPTGKAAGTDVDPDDEDDSDDDCSGKEATPDIVKDPQDGDGGKVKKPKKGKKLPPWLNSDDSEKCHTPPDQAAGVPGHDMEAAPVGELQESPKPDHMKSAVALRYKTLGIDGDLGKLHDLICPAFHPSEVGKYFPGEDASSAVDPDLWQRKALAAATGKSIAEAIEAQQAWQAATVLKTADQGVIYDYRLELNKAFRDANPGPSSALSPTAINPKKFNRGLISDGHSATSDGHGSPNSSPSVASSAPNAHHFDSPPLSSGHQSPSPSHMKSDFPYPTEQGVPTNLSYSQIEKEKARRALSMMHDHLIHMAPSVCPILDQDAYRVEQPTPVPATVGLGKSEVAESEPGEEVLGDVYKFIRKLEKKVRAGEISEAEARDRLSKRTAEKYAKSLAKQVSHGMTSRDEVLKALGIEIPKPVEVAEPEPQVVGKAATVTDTSGALTPDLMKSMMTEILQPFEEKINAQNKHIDEQTALLSSYQEKMEAQAKELESHQARWDALANQADPSTAAFKNLTLNPAQRPSRPADVTKSAEDRVQGMMVRQLERAWRTSENPAEREAAYDALQKYKG
jgi:phage head maturation protease